MLRLARNDLVYKMYLLNKLYNEKEFITIPSHTL